MRNQKGQTLIIVAILTIIVIAGLAFYFMKNRVSNLSNTTPRSNYLNQAVQPAGQTSPGNTTNQVSVPAVNNPQDLTTVSNNLDNTDISGLNTQLNQNDIDAQSFAPRIKLKNGKSLNWAGYAVETNLSNPQNNTVSDVKGSWIVPALTCTSTNTYSATWVGIDGYSDNTVEQTGTEQDCINGQPSYYAWFEMYPKPSFRINLPVKAGDTINAEVKYIGGNKFTLTLNDATTGQTFSTTKSSNGQRQSAEWIVEAPWSGGILPLANFGTLPFSNASTILNGHTGTISDTSWQNDAITMTNSSGSPKATPSGLSNNGSSFSVIWNSSN